MKKIIFLALILVGLIGVLIYNVYQNQIPQEGSGADYEIQEQGEEVTGDTRPNLLPVGPGEDALVEELTAFYELVNDLSVEGDTIELGTLCEVSPLVLKIQSGTSIKIINKDAQDHRIELFSETQEVPIQSVITFETASFTGGGIYGLSCEGFGEQGYVLILEVPEE